MFSDAEIQVIAEMLQVSSWLSAWDPGTGADAAMVDPAFMASDAAAMALKNFPPVKTKDFRSST